MKLILTYYLLLGLIYISLAVFLVDSEYLTCMFRSLKLLSLVLIELFHAAVFILLWPVVLVKDLLGIKTSYKNKAL